MFELRTYLAFLLKATVFACAAVACLWILYHAVQLATVRQARADLMYAVSLAPTANLPATVDDDAIWASVSSESNAILNWVQFCDSIDDPYRLPVAYQLYFVNQARQPPPDAQFAGRVPHRVERSLLELNIAANRLRFSTAKRAQAAFDFWQTGSLLIIALGAASTIMIGLSSTQFGRESGTTQQVMRTLAIIFPALSTAATAAMAFYGPQAEWAQASATSSSLSQLHSQIATGLQTMECAAEPAAGTPLSTKVVEWTNKYQEIITATNAARATTPDSTKKDAGNPGR